MDNFYEEIDLIDNQLNVNPIDFSNCEREQKKECVCNPIGLWGCPGLQIDGHGLYR